MSGSPLELTTDAEIHAWHDEAYGEYEVALVAHTADPTDEAAETAYVEARDHLMAGVAYWRLVGESTGKRPGVVITEEG